MSSEAREPVEILLVEDNPGDQRLVREGLRRWLARTRLRIVSDGEQALAAFQDETTRARRPDLVILDLNLPKRDGRELLEALRSRPALAGIPVVVLTSSSADRELLESRGLASDLYIVKPVALADYLAAVASIETFWRDGLADPRGPAAGQA